MEPMPEEPSEWAYFTLPPACHSLSATRFGLHETCAPAKVQNFARDDMEGKNRRNFIYFRNQRGLFLTVRR